MQKSKDEVEGEQRIQNSMSFQSQRAVAVHQQMVSEKTMVQEKDKIQVRGMQNIPNRIPQYLSQQNFWVSEFFGQQEVNDNEFARRIIVMGQFLESKAIERL